MKTFKEMEDKFYWDVRAELLGGLERCTGAQQLKFKWVQLARRDWSIQKVVANLPRRKLDWAMRIVQRTLTATAE